MTTVITPISWPSVTATLFPQREDKAVPNLLPQIYRQAYQDLPLARLSPYEKVSDQFIDYGLTMEGAIALLPSNPSFINQTPTLNLMPLGQFLPLRITLVRPWARIRLQLRGYQDFSLYTLDDAGQGLPLKVLSKTRYQQEAQAPQETISLNTQSVQQVVVTSPGTFLVTGLGLFAEANLIRTGPEHF